MSETRGELTIEIAANADSDTEELAELTTQLNSELLHLDVDAVRSASRSGVPDASKAAAPLMVGGLIVRFALRQDILQSIIHGVQSWLGRRHARVVKLTIDGDSLELTGATLAQQDQLVELWVKRHAGGG